MALFADLWAWMKQDWSRAAAIVASVLVFLGLTLAYQQATRNQHEMLEKFTQLINSHEVSAKVRETQLSEIHAMVQAEFQQREAFRNEIRSDMMERIRQSMKNVGIREDDIQKVLGPPDSAQLTPERPEFEPARSVGWVDVSEEEPGPQFINPERPELVSSGQISDMLRGKRRNSESNAVYSGPPNSPPDR